MIVPSHEAHRGPFPHQGGGEVELVLTSEQVRPSSSSSRIPSDPRPTTDSAHVGEEQSSLGGGDPFSHIDQIMHLEALSPEEIRAHPAFVEMPSAQREVVVRHVPQLSREDLAQIKLAYLSRRMRELAESANYNLVEIGRIIALGNLVGLARMVGCESMYEWARISLHIDKDVLSLAVDKYNAYLYIKEYGFGPESLIGASRVHIQAISDMRRDIHRQQEEIKRRKLEARLSPTTRLTEQGREEEREETVVASSLGERALSREEQESLHQEVAADYQSLAQAEIEHILSLSTEDLSAERHPGYGSILRPHLSLTVSFDPTSGTLAVLSGRGYLTEAHLRGLAKGQLSLSFHLAAPPSGGGGDEGATLSEAVIKPTLSTKELGQTILEHCPPMDRQEEEEDQDQDQQALFLSSSATSEEELL